MSKYVIEFSKTGIICFTSHLDLMRVFQRAFKRADIPLAYSQGFNPHPKMGFAQPLSLGYWGMGEYIEFETREEYLPNELLVRLAEGLPEGLELKECLQADRLKKTLSAHTVAAEYMIRLPAVRDAVGAAAGRPGSPAVDLSDPRAMWLAYMDRPEIPAKKRQKKKKERKTVDIRPMIREITFMPVESDIQGGHDAESGCQAARDEDSGGRRNQTSGTDRQGSQAAQAGEPGSHILYIDAVLDSGSASNLSPELIVASVTECFGITADRSTVSIMRKGIVFDKPLEQLLEGR